MTRRLLLFKYFYLHRVLHINWPYLTKGSLFCRAMIKLTQKTDFCKHTSLWFQKNVTETLTRKDYHQIGKEKQQQQPVKNTCWFYNINHKYVWKHTGKLDKNLEKSNLNLRYCCIRKNQRNNDRKLSSGS